MKKTYGLQKVLIILFFFFLIAGNCQSHNLKITPIILNFLGVTVQDSITVAFADFGSVLISRDNDKNWEQKRIFDGGEIINLFIDGNKMSAFNDRGEVASSIDFGRNWKTVHNYDDSILAVSKTDQGYFIRMRNKLITVFDNYELKNEISVQSVYLSRQGLYFMPNYRKSILQAGDFLIAEIDSSNFIRFDKDLNPLDTLDLLPIVDSSRYSTGYRIIYDSDSEYTYLKYVGSTTYYFGAVYRTKDFKNIEKYKDCKAWDCYNIYKGKYYSLNLAAMDIKLTDTTKLSTEPYVFPDYFKEGTVENDKLYIAGDRKLLQILDLKDSSLKVVSEYTGLSYDSGAHEMIDDSTYLFFPYETMGLYKTTNDGTTILPTVDKIHPKYQYRSNVFYIRNHYYDKEERKLYLFGNNSFTNTGKMWISTDDGASFDSLSLEGTSLYPSALFFMNASLIKNNIQKEGNVFIFPGNFYLGQDKVIRSIIYYVNKEGIVLKYILGYNVSYNYVYSKDINTCLVHSCDVIDSCSQIIYTKDGGESWELIHKYPINETVGRICDIEVAGRKYLALVHSDNTKYPDFILGRFLDVVDKETNKYTRIAAWGTDSDHEYGFYGIGICSDGGKAYISFQDTLFVTDDILNKKNWSYYLLPEGGRMVSHKKFGNRFYCNYTDNNNPYGKSIFWIEPPLDSLQTNVEEQASGAYLNAYPPFPLPATDRVQTLIYWDTNQEFSPGDVTVHNIYGEKVSKDEEITLDRLNSYSGYLRWDCSSVPNGVFLIKIKHGVTTRIVKAIVSR